MKTLEIANANRILSDYAKDLGDEILILTSNKRPIAAIVSLKNVDLESLSLSTSPEFMKIIEKSRHEFKVGKQLSLEKMHKEVLKMNSQK